MRSRITGSRQSAIVRKPFVTHRASSRAVMLHCKCLGLTGNAGGADAQMTSVEASEVQRVINDVMSVQKSPLNGALCNS